MKHGTMYAYNKLGCRCDACKQARRDLYHGGRHGPQDAVATELLTEILQEMFPLGLTDDCPARKALRGETG
jgi:hypothetical protein